MRLCGKLSLGFSLPAPGKEDSNGESGGLGVPKVHLQSCQQVPLFLDFLPVFAGKMGEGDSDLASLLKFREGSRNDNSGL